MCGITGIVSHSNVTTRLYKSLLNLEYRGYDSCGIAVITPTGIEIRKDKGEVRHVGDRYKFSEMVGNVGIGHTRWATTGVPNQVNAHPHLSCHGDIAVVHNGILNNYRSIREFLQNDGHIIRSETDTEVIAHLIEHFFQKTSDLELSLRQTLELIEGTYALAFITSYAPDLIFAAKKESPLIIGLGDGENYIGSDHNAILEYTRRVISLRDAEYVIMNRNSVTIKKLHSGEIIDHEISWLDWDPELSRKGGYPHFMLKEIHEQPETIKKILQIPSEQILKLAQAIETASRVYLIGVGTTYYVALIAQYYFTRLTHRQIYAISSDEFNYLAQVDPDSLVIAFSQSGETYDTLQALRYAKRNGAMTAAIINVMGSTMVHEVDVSIMQASGPEICVLSTKAASAQIAVALRVAIELGCQSSVLSQSDYQHSIEALNDLPRQIRLMINESKGFINTIATRNAHIKNWLFIGRGVYCGIALESALKMKEVTYRHAEGMPGGFMKHGTIALIEDGVGSIFFLPPKSDKELYEHSMINAEEIRTRKGFLVAFGFDEKSQIFDDQVRLPVADPLTAPLLLMVVGQLFAYYSAVALKRDVDKPRSLAKSVTVA